MPQGTNSIAYQRLKPLENTNTGALIEEHKRYWRKYKDDKEADDLAKEQQKEEFKRKIKKDAFTMYQGLSDIDAKGYFTEQVINYKKQNDDKWLDLSKRASAGDDDAFLLLQQEKEKLQNIVGGSVAISNKTKELFDLKQAGTFNKYRDQDLSDFIDTIAKSNYYLDPEQGKFRIIDKNNPNILMEVDPLKLTNEFLSSNYHEALDFDEVGKDIAGTINQKSTDGNIDITEANTRSSNISVLERLRKDENFYVSVASSQDVGKDYDDLSDPELNDMANKFTENFVLRNLDDVDNSLNNESKKSDLKTKKQNRDLKKKKADDEANSNSVISIATDEQDNQLKTVSGLLQDANKNQIVDLEGVAVDISEFVNKDGNIYNLTSKPTIEKVEGNKKTSTTFTHIVKDDNGNIYVLGDREAIVGTGEFKNQVEITKKVVEKLVISEKSELNEVATQLKYSNLSDMSDDIDKIQNAFDNPEIEGETEEERLDRLIKEAE